MNAPKLKRKRLYAINSEKGDQKMRKQVFRETVISSNVKQTFHNKEENPFYIEFMRMKESLSVWKNLFNVSLDQRTRAWDELDALWDPLRSRYAWAVPDARSLAILREFSPLIEIGAGKGYWASLLQAEGVDIVPFDIRGCPKGWHEPGGIKYKNDWWTEVRTGGPGVLKDKAFMNRSLLLCYPDEDESIAIQCLENYSGSIIIHVGELQVGAGTAGGIPQAPYGRTSSGEFQRQLSASFHPLLIANLKARLPYARDCISVWKRTQFVPGRLSLKNDSNSGDDDDDDANSDSQSASHDASGSAEEEENGSDAESADSYAAFNQDYFADFYEHEKMLSDKARMDFYFHVIRQGVAKGNIVVDVGTGTGILAAFASRAGAAYVYAIDHNENVVTCAEDIALRNGLRNVEFVVGSGKEFVLPLPRSVPADPHQVVPDMKVHQGLIKKSKVDVILHEQMGDCLFDEDMVANITDLRDRILKPGGVILPSCYDLFVEPVQLDSSRNVPFIWQLNDVHGYDYSCLASPELREKYQVDTNRGYHHVRSSDPSLVSHMLCDPQPILSIDLHTITEGSLSRDLCFTKHIRRSGRIDGCAVYFRCRHGGMTLETAPHAENRASHWGYRILRVEGILAKENEVYDVRLCVGRWADLNSWFWDTSKRARNQTSVRPEFLRTPLLAAAEAALERSQEDAEDDKRADGPMDDSRSKPSETRGGREAASAAQRMQRLREREKELDVQYAEDDQKTWANIPLVEILPVDRAAPCLAHLL